MKGQQLPRNVLAEINQVRSNPKSYIPKLEKTLQFYNGMILSKPGQDMIETEEGAAAVQDCIQALRKAKSAPPLEWSDGIAKAAQDHVNDIGPKGLMGHSGSDGSDPGSRI